MCPLLTYIICDFMPTPGPHISIYDFMPSIALHIYIYILCKSNYWNCIRFPAQIINEQTELARAAQPTV